MRDTKQSSKAASGGRQSSRSAPGVAPLSNTKKNTVAKERGGKREQKGTENLNPATEASSKLREQPGAGGSSSTNTQKSSANLQAGRLGEEGSSLL